MKIMTIFEAENKKIVAIKKPLVSTSSLSSKLRIQQQDQQEDNSIDENTSHEYPSTNSNESHKGRNTRSKVVLTISTSKYLYLSIQNIQ